MKKLFLAFLAVGSIATAQAQKAGSILLYGNVGVSAVRSADDNNTIGPDLENHSTTWNINPGIGYQFNNNWTVGLNVGFAGNRQSTETISPLGVVNDDVVRTYYFNVGPFVRYTMPINKTFFFFDQVNLSYLHAKTVNEVAGVGNDIESEFNGFDINMIPAFGINVTRCVALNFSFGGIGYTTGTNTVDGANNDLRYNAFNFDFGSQANIGISANLGGYRHTRGGNMEPGMERRRMNNAYDEDDAPKRKKKMNDDEDEE